MLNGQHEEWKSLMAVMQRWAQRGAHHLSNRFLQSDDADMRAGVAFDALVERHNPSEGSIRAEA